MDDESLDTKLNWVASYPKSGNTWIRLVARTYAGGDADMRGLGTSGDLNLQIFHDVSPLPLRQLGMSDEVQLRPAALLALAAGHQGAETLFKSHHGYYDIEGMQLWRGKWVHKVVNPVRDPRDVCCSAHHHFGHESYMKTAEFMNTKNLHIGGGAKELHHFVGSWSQHVKSWMDSPLPVLTVRYEDMLYNDLQCFRKVLDFVLEDDVEEKRLERAVKRCRFDELQELEDEHGFPEKTGNQDRFFRKGQSEGWEDELPGDVARKIEDDHGDMMEELQYL